MRKLFIILLLFAGCDFINNDVSSKSPLIVLCFDDGHESIYDLAFPLMQQYQYPGVNFIPTGWINNSGVMNLEEIHEMAEAGWETGGHTVTHANLTTISIDSARAEISNNYNQLINFGLTHRCFALPAGHSNPEIDAIIKQYFEIIRTSYNERYNFPLNKDRLGYYQVEENDDENSLLLRVTHGIAEGECLIIFGFHQFTVNEPTFICMMNISIFQKFLEGLKKRNLEVVTLSQAVNRLSE
ncbi:MAG: polysaccharide deacetylase family protein [Ignavibacteriaceae bacterium]|nr:polysaccharide deacetylase family protein [Ignavibacterium sp.]MCC6256285.1 polysaccharide deacetylase family protein [Ignavibacteriaceae bacterium]HMN23840.1 polysaccharide deacetylase family protein [Ignavibacteriaceae bacterium]HRN26548.1 polysaccharide deacetylase family protein [Ignavibacteriaceae bacterium]HRP91829.1 polysaccharide deacetylase family protein [Ignavibacteriaceae bacterium]